MPVSRRPHLLAAVALLGLAAAASPAGVATAAEGSGTGIITGRILVTDPPPPHGEHPVTRDQEICGDRMPDERLVIAEDGALGNAVVSLLGASRDGAPGHADRPRVTSAGCRFVPHVLAMEVGQKLEVVNGDPLIHRTHAKLDGMKTVFDVALQVQNQKIPRRIEAPGILELECDAGHAWESAWVLAFDHPWFAVTGPDGAFRIEGVPAGRHTVRAWHEELGTQDLQVTVPAGGAVRLEFRSLSRRGEQGISAER